MWSFNDWVKLWSQALITLHIMTGLLLVGYGLYVVFLPWGRAETELYQAASICMVLFGACFALVSQFGCDSIDIQVKRLGKGWTGRSFIALYTWFLVAVCVALAYSYAYGRHWLSSIHDTIEQLKADPSSHPTYSYSEGELSQRFNALFFNVVYHCEVKYSWFWVYIQHNCPSTLNQQNCEHCESYSISFCIADEPTCYSVAPQGQNYACPYDACRLGTLQFIYNISNNYFEIIIYIAGLVTLSIIVLNLVLIRHSQIRKMTVKIVEERGEMEIELPESPHLSAALQPHTGSDHGSDDHSYFYNVSDPGEVPASTTAPATNTSGAASALLNAPSRQLSRANSPHPGTLTHQSSALEDALIASLLELDSSTNTRQNSGLYGVGAGATGASSGAAKPSTNIASEAQLEIAIMESIELQTRVKSQDDVDLELAIIQSVRTSTGASHRSRKYQSLSQSQDQQQTLSTSQSQQSRLNKRSIKVTNPASPLSGGTGGRDSPSFAYESVATGGSASNKGTSWKSAGNEAGRSTGADDVDSDFESAVLESVLHSSSQDHR